MIYYILVVVVYTNYEQIHNDCIMNTRELKTKTRKTLSNRYFAVFDHNVHRAFRIFVEY